MHGSVFEFEGLPAFGQLLPPRRDNARPATARAVPLVGIVRNPRSHRNRAKLPEMAECSNILTQVPTTRDELLAALVEFARRGIDYLVVDGGDGTVRDVLSCGADVFGHDWPPLIVLPKGKTNALAVDLGLPGEWTLIEALAAAKQGRTIRRAPLRVTSAEGARGCAQGFFLGAGAFTLGTKAGQKAHRHGAFNSFAVGLIVLWAVVQALFGRCDNPWRASTRMRLSDPRTGEPLAHSGRGHPDERYLAVITTFERFPLGARPFGASARSGIKIGMIDWPVRWLMLMLPAMLFGADGSMFRRNGATRTHVEELAFDLGGSFILDGEAFPAGRYLLEKGPQLTFVVP